MSAKTARFLVDTDVMIDFLRGRPEAIRWVKRKADRITLSVVVLAELFAGARDDAERSELDALSSLFPVLDVSTEIARQGGILKHRFHPSHGTGLADALIAATAEIHDMELKTLNVRHYPMIPGLEPAYRKA